MATNVAEETWEHSGSASDQEEEEEALSLCDLPVNFIEEEINNQEINNQSGKEEIDEETGTNQEEFNFGPFCGGGCVSTDSEMCAAEDVFFQGQILPLRLSVSSETGQFKFKQDTSLNPSRSVSRSESMDHNFFSSRSSSCRSHYSSSSTSTSNSNSIATPIRTTSSKPRVQNQFRYSLPSPKPQIRLSSASKGNAASNRTRSSSMWDLFRLGLVRTPEIELHDLKVRSSVSRNSSCGSSNSNCSIKNSKNSSSSSSKIINSGSSNSTSSSNSKSTVKKSCTIDVGCGSRSSDPSSSSRRNDGKNVEKQRKQGFLERRGGLLSGCSCSVGAAEPVPVNIVIMKDSNSPGNGNNEKAERGCSVDEKLLLELKMKKRMEQKQQGKQATSRHRTFEWIKELSHASYLDHEEERRAS